MTLQGEISSGNLTKIRSDNYQAQQFVAVVPDEIVVQFQASVAPTLGIYAEITVGTVASGSMSNVKSNQTVIYSTSTDYQATEKYRTYVRKVSGTTTLYIGQTGQNLTTSLYVTVLNQYDAFEKPATERGGTRYNNWDVTFRRLLPIETALPSAVVLIDGATAWTPTGVPLEMDNDATSTFTHAWESSNSNDSLDSGGTTASPSWTLQAGAFRWIRYTFTDSNGNSNLRVMAVWTVPKDLSSVVNLGFIGQSNDVANISYALNQGWSCTLPAISGISTIPKGQMVCIFSIEDYNGVRGSIESNIDFVGFLGIENTPTGGDEQYGRISETHFIVDSIHDLLQDTPLSKLNITSTSSPSAWDDIENPTPMRVATYLLTEFTTFAHLCAIKIPADHTDFVGDNNILDSDFDMVYDAIQYQADALDGIIQYSRDGILDITRNLVQLDGTARTLADTVVTMTPRDWEFFDPTISPRPTLRFLIVYAGVLNTTSNTYDTYRAVVPPQPDNRGVNEEQRPNLIITTDATDGEARTELGERAGNLYAALNPTDIIRVTLKDEWRFLQPDVGSWYKFTIAATDTVRGWAYTGNTRWQLLDISYSSNNETGRKEVQATFRRETQSTGANIVVSRVETDPDNDTNAVPGVLPPFTGGDLELTDGEWFDPIDTAPPSDPNPPGADCELVSFIPSIDTSGAQTVRSALTGESIAYVVSGYGLLQDGTNATDDFSAGAGDWESSTVGDHWVNDGGSVLTAGTAGTLSGGQFVHGDITVTGGADQRCVQLDIDFGSLRRITSFSALFDITKGLINPDTRACAMLGYSQDGVTYTALETLEANEVANGTDREISYEDETGVDARYLFVMVRSSQGTHNGSCAISEVAYSGPIRYGDALYQWSEDDETPEAYDTDEGFLFENSSPINPRTYSADHTYQLYDDSVDAGPLELDFVTPYTVGELSNWVLEVTVCFLGVS